MFNKTKIKELEQEIISLKSDLKDFNLMKEALREYRKELGNQEDDEIYILYELITDHRYLKNLELTKNKCLVEANAFLANYMNSNKLIEKENLKHMTINQLFNILNQEG